MGMTINESISIFEAKGKYSLTEKENEAKEVAIDTMRKYQKIEQILKSLDDGEINYLQMTYYLREVLEDGNDY